MDMREELPLEDESGPLELSVPGPESADGPEFQAAETAGMVEGSGVPSALIDAEERHVRLLAEFDNFRRRAFREREQALETGMAGLARPPLAVLDNLERALAHSAASPGPLREGVEMTVRQFRDILRGAGVVAIDPGGEAFDPVYHEAVTTQPSGDVPADHVLLVVSRGYRLGHRVLRPAQVIVSSGPDRSPDP